MNQVVTELVIDARGATAGAAQYAEAMARARIAAEGLETANQKAQAAQDRQVAALTGPERRAENGWKRLQSQIDPVAMSLLRVEQAQAKVDAAMQRGRTTQEQAGRVMDAFIAKQRELVQAAGSQAMLATPAHPTRLQDALNQAMGVVDTPRISARESAAAFEEAARSADQMAARVTALRAQIDPLGAAQDRLNAELAEYQALANAGAISAAELTAAQLMANQRFAGMGPAVRTVGSNTALTTHEMTNLSFQLNDIGVMLASGQSPFILLMQQGMQVGQILGPRGLRGALTALGPAIMSFLLSPVNLAIVGFAAATAGAVALFRAISGGSADAERHLERHKELISQVRDQWKSAEDGVHDYAATSKAVLIAEATRNREALQADFLAQARDRVPTPLVGSGVMQSFGVMGTMIKAVPEIEAAMLRLQEAVRNGNPDFRAFRDEMADIFNIAPADSLRRELAGHFLDEARGLAELQGEVELATDLEKGLTGETKKLARAIGETTDRIEAAERAVEEYVDALEALQDIGKLELSNRDLAAEKLRAAVDAAQGLDDVVVLMNEYARAIDRVAAAEEKADLKGLADAQFQLSTLGLSDYAKGVAEINREFDERITDRLNEGGDAAGLERERTLRLEYFDAERESDFNQMLADRQRKLSQEAGALGLSEAALAKYRTEVELTNDAMRLFGQVSPEMELQITAMGDAAARWVETQRQMTAQIAAMDSLRGDVRGFLGDLVGGLRQGESAADALRSAIDRLISRFADMGLDMLVTPIVGRQGTMAFQENEP